MPNKINPGLIIKQHIDTLHDGRDGNLSLGDIVFFFGLPLAIAVIFIIFNIKLNTNAMNSLLVSLSIFTPLLLSLLVLIYDMGQKAVDKFYKQSFIGNFERHMSKLKQINANISFSILISITAIIFLIILSLNQWDDTIWIYNSLILILNGFIYFCLGVFSLTLLMILKRTHKLIFESLSV